MSSSGHVTLIPWLAGWPYAALDPELRKAFEVALHAGTAAALLIALRGEVGEAARGFDRRRATLVALSCLPPAVAGLLLERPIERRLGSPRSIAVGLLLGSAAMVLADTHPGHRCQAPFARAGRGCLAPLARRRRADAGALDGLVLGLAQACALVPGASRNGMTLAAARARGFGREDANALSRHVALPIIVGASVLKGTRLARRGLSPAMGVRFAVGTAASFCSTLGSTWLIRQVERDRSLAPYAAYRAALALIVLTRE